MFTPRRSQSAQATRNRRSDSHRAYSWTGLLLLGMAICLPASAGTASAPSGQAATHLAAANGKTAPDTMQVVRINVSAAQAARAARHEYGGKVLAVRLEANGKAPYYRVKLLSGGRVQVVHVTAHE